MIPLHASAPVEALVITDPFPAAQPKPLSFWFGGDAHLDRYLEIEAEFARLLAEYIGFEPGVGPR